VIEKTRQPLTAPQSEFWGNAVNAFDLWIHNLEKLINIMSTW